MSECVCGWVCGCVCVWSLNSCISTVIGSYNSRSIASFVVCLKQRVMYIQTLLTCNVYVQCNLVQY